MKTRVKVVFYGDDFTGSSENLAQFHRNGVRAKLYLNIPTREQLEIDATAFDVLGIAGTARSLSDDDMRLELRGAFKEIQRMGCNFVQYKICSTFDSSPVLGSFGVVLEEAETHFGKLRVGVLAATPDFGRYTVFGNHFVRFGADVLRLDRHPSMANHPKTPMGEADLRLHLKKQSQHAFRNITVADYATDRLLEIPLFDQCAADIGVIFDAQTNEHVSLAARALWQESQRAPVFALAAQGLAQSLGQIWREDGQLSDPQPVATEIQPVESLLVLSGSCALQNGKQIEVAEKSGWESLFLDPLELMEERRLGEAVDSLTREACTSLASGRPTIIYTAKGMTGRIDADAVPSSSLGSAYAAITRSVRKQLRLPRIVFAGGDSSSYAVKNSGAQALEISVFDLEQNSHVCRLSAPDHAELDGLEVMLKGGQVGNEDYYLRALQGTRKAA